MNKTWKVSILCIAVLGVVGCRANTPSVIEMPKEATAQQPISFEDKNIAIAYFTRAENIVVEDGMDTTTAASTVVRNDKMVGNTGYVAEVIQEQVGGTLYPIHMVNPYVTDYDDSLPKQEQSDQARPEIEQILTNVEDYDIIFLGYPNWWYDMPMAVYTFLESHDFDGKTIIPFVTHGGSKFSDTIETLRTMYPNAIVYEGLEIFQHDVVNREDEIKQWLEGMKP